METVIVDHETLIIDHKKGYCGFISKLGNAYYKTIYQKKNGISHILETIKKPQEIHTSRSRFALCSFKAN